MTKTLQRWERIALVVLLLGAWALRWAGLLDVPPGWRDDDLIELYTFSQEILRSGPRLYFTGASGHEPLYHTLRAVLIAVAGINQASARFCSASAGLLAVLLTWAVARRMFTRDVGLLAGAASAVSFWSLMYSRIAVRHIAVLPWSLLAIYWAWRLLQDKRAIKAGIAGLAAGVAGALTTYYAGRLLPALIVVMLLAAGLPFVRKRWGYVLTGLLIGLALAAPMFWAVSQAPGGDARVSELAVPLTALRSGDPAPLLQTVWTTLGMAHAKGDPEWLYNISERPVFGPLAAVVFFLGILTRLGHIHQANARVLLLWLALGIAPAFISLPPSSYGHTILALPIVYILLSMPMKAAARRWRWTAIPLLVITFALVAVRDLPDYFVTWPSSSMVRFLYRADYRSLQEYTSAHPERSDIAAGSLLAGPWDKVAVATDGQAANLTLRWVNPRRALVFFPDSPTLTFLQDEGEHSPVIAYLLDRAAPVAAPAGMQGYLIEYPEPPAGAIRTDGDGLGLAEQTFGGALVLEAVACRVDREMDCPGAIMTWWRVDAPLRLPEEELIPHPAPPGVYSGPRLKVFAHLYQDREQIAGDDGLWVDPYTLRPGDRFIQVHEFTGLEEFEPLELVLGLYDPATGARWLTPSGADSIRVALP